MRDLRLELSFFLLAACASVLGHGLPTAGPTGFALRARDPGTLRIVTWNVGGAVDGQPQALPDDGVAHVGEILTELDADIVALQELGSRRQAGRLAQRLGSEWIARSSGRGLALLARTSLTMRRLDLGGRAQGARLSVRDQPIVVTNVHASAFDAEQRNELLGRAADELQRSDQADLRILLGDLNLDVDLDKKRDLFSNRAHLDVETYNYVARGLSDAARGRGATAEPDRRLDYVFVSPAVTILAAGPWKGRRGGGMDHDPVVVDLRP